MNNKNINDYFNTKENVLNHYFLRQCIDLYFDYIYQGKSIPPKQQYNYEKNKYKILHLKEWYNDCKQKYKNYLTFIALGDTLYLCLTYISLIDKLCSMGANNE